MAAPGASKFEPRTVPYSGELKDGLMLTFRGTRESKQLYATVLITNYSRNDNTFKPVIGRYSYDGNDFGVNDVKYENGAFTFTPTGNVQDSFQVAFLELDLDGTSSGG